MKNYSFSNIASEDSYAVCKSNDFSNLYRHSEIKSNEANLRIEQIKKKYDTPSRRQRIESMKKSKDYEIPHHREEPRVSQARGQARESVYQQKQTPIFANPLRQSFAVNRLEKSTLKNDYNSKDFMNIRGERDVMRRSNEKQNDFPSYMSNNREQEQAIFSKVREMKESIINNDYMKNSINGRCSIKSGKYLEADKRIDGRKEVDPRVQNIDKINNKIKHILSSLSENQKHIKDTSHSYLRDQHVTPYTQVPSTASFLRDQNSSNSHPTITCHYPKQTSSSPYKQQVTNSLRKQDVLQNKESAFFGIKAKQISESKKSYQSHFHKNSDVVQKYNLSGPKPIVDEPKQKQIAEPQRNKRDNYNPQACQDYQKSLSKDYSVNKVNDYKKEYSVSRPIKRQQQLVKTPSYLSKYQAQSKGLKASRSKSQIDNFKRSTLGSAENDILRSGKKLNDQIQKIQKKIEQFQKEKRKLNIQFTPFTLKNKSTANLNDSSKGERQSESRELNNGLSRDSSKYDNQRSTSSDYKFKSYMNRTANYEQKYGEFNKGKENYAKETGKSASVYGNFKPKLPEEVNFELKIQSGDVQTVRIDNNIENNQEENINNVQVAFDEIAIKKRTDEGIEYRRKRLQGDNDIIKTQTLKKLVILFCQQVKLDENFRNLKIWLQSSFETDKMHKVMRSLQKLGVKLTLNECQIIFAVDQSQHNPFFSIQTFQGSYEALASAFLQSDKHWRNKLQHKFDRNSLVCQGLTSQKIDLQRKNFIQLEDLVRFLNIQSGTFYRNRDLFLIFKRFTSSQRLNFESMICQISG